MTSEITKNDVATLRAGAWMDESLMSHHIRGLKSSANHNSYCFLDSINVRVLLAANPNDDLTAIPKVLEICSRPVTFAVMHNGTDDGTNTTHWFLLIGVKASNKVYLLNSGNDDQLGTSYRRFVENTLCKYMKISNVIETITCTHQPNDNDCGLYVLANIHKAMEYFENSTPLRNVWTLVEEITALRLSILDSIPMDDKEILEANVGQ